MKPLSAFHAFLNDYNQLGGEINALRARIAELESQLTSPQVQVERDAKDADEELIKERIRHQTAEGLLRARIAELEAISVSKITLTELEARQVPEGWQAVPKEPTDEMFFNPDDVCVNMNQTPWDSFVKIYQRMLAAAPSPADSGEEKPQSPERADRPMKYSGWDEDDDTSNLMGG